MNQESSVKNVLLASTALLLTTCLLAPSALADKLHANNLNNLSSLTNQSSSHYVWISGDYVVVVGPPGASYLLVVHEHNQVTHARMIYGQYAFGIIPGAAQKTIDVFQVGAIGTLEWGNFKPCHPDNNPNQPNCTPTSGFPPVPPKRFLRIEQFLP
jgi:hypothetical protein